MRETGTGNERTPDSVHESDRGTYTGIDRRSRTAGPVGNEDVPTVRAQEGGTRAGRPALSVKGQVANVTGSVTDSAPPLWQKAATDVNEWLQLHSNQM